MSIDVKKLEVKDKGRVLGLLATDDLRPEGILEKGTTYWGAFDGDKLVGVIGCEYENNCGLLRSALVDHAYRKLGIAKMLTRALLTEAAENDLEAVYLFSTEAGAYWARLGFVPVAVEEATRKLGNTPQVKLFEQLGWLPTEMAFKLASADF